MKKSTKAALLSGLLFPGTGQIYLKRYVSGIIILVGAAVALYIILSALIGTASEIAEMIQNGTVSLDPIAISDLINQKLRGKEQTLNVAEIALVGFWIVGIIDSYRQGQRDEKHEEDADEKGI